MASSYPLSGASQALVTAPGRYVGFSIRETTGAATAVVRLWDNASAASGTSLEEISLAAGESAREYYGDGGIRTTFGVYVQIVSGAIVGSVRAG